MKKVVVFIRCSLTGVYLYLGGCITIHHQIKINIMYNKIKPQRTTIKHNKSYQGDTIEVKMLKLKANKEPIKDGAPIIYTDRSQGVVPTMDIRTDRFEEALNLRSALADKKVAKRGANTKNIGKQAAEGMKKEGETPAGEEKNN